MVSTTPATSLSSSSSFPSSISNRRLSRYSLQYQCHQRLERCCCYLWLYLTYLILSGILRLVRVPVHYLADVVTVSFQPLPIHPLLLLNNMTSSTVVSSLQYSQNKRAPRYYYSTTIPTIDRVTFVFSSSQQQQQQEDSSFRPTSSASSSSQLLLASSSRHHAIVYLVQKTHSTYHQRDSFGLLLQSLDLLFEHYFDCHYYYRNTTTTNTFQKQQQQQQQSIMWNKLNTTDIYLFHTGDFTRKDLEFLEDRYAKYYYYDYDKYDYGGSDPLYNNNNNDHNYPVLPHYHHDRRPYASMFRLVDLSHSKYWQVPKALRHENASSWFRYPQFSLGYRHMCSWFAIGIWDFFDKLHHYHSLFDYTYLWRMDEDSFLLSPIHYNIFDYMQQQHYIYGYRLCSYELDYNYYMKAWFDKWHARTQPHRTIVLEHAGMCAFYNNFFVAQISWFRQAPVQDFLKRQRAKIYRMRYGDLLLHTMALYAYAHDDTIHRFLDFTYQHVTLNTSGTSQCVLYGGIQAGYNDPQATTTLQHFYQQQQPIQQHDCQEPLQRFHLQAHDLSPTYQHLLLPSDNVINSHRHNVTTTNISLETIVVGRMEIPGKGILSG